MTRSRSTVWGDDGKMIQFKQLEAIFWLRELGSFQKVAEKLHVTQPAVSTRIATLEELVGARLVERNPSGLVLTNLGQELAEHAEKIIRQRDVMLERVHRDRRTSLRIAAVGPIMFTWGPMLKARLTEEMPTTKVEFTIGSNVQIERDIRADAVEIAILSMRPKDESSASSFSMSYDIGWVGAPDLVGDIPQPATNRDIGAKDLVLYPPTSPLFSPVETHLSRTTGPRHFANSLATIVEMLRAGVGLSAIPTAVVRRDIEKGRLQIVTPKNPIAPLRIQCQVVTRNRKRNAEIALEFARQVACDYARSTEEHVSFLSPMT